MQFECHESWTKTWLGCRHHSWVRWHWALEARRSVGWFSVLIPFVWKWEPLDEKASVSYWLVNHFHTKTLDHWAPLSRTMWRFCLHLTSPYSYWSSSAQKTHSTFSTSRNDKWTRQLTWFRGSMALYGLPVMVRNVYHMRVSLPLETFWSLIPYRD